MCSPSLSLHARTLRHVPFMDQCTFIAPLMYYRDAGTLCHTNIHAFFRTITRSDTQGEGWGMNLRFDCGDAIGGGEKAVTDWTIAGNLEDGWLVTPL